MADWQAIETEYITTNTSYRKLADKYGIDQATISRKAKKEDWVSKRQRHISETQAKVLAADTKQKVSRAEKLIGVADLLLDKVKQLVESDETIFLDTQGMKHISGVLKDIKEIQMIRSDADMAEQEARIAKLRREAEKDEAKDTGYHGVVLIPAVAPMPAPPEDCDG
jgi:tRNA-dihydrouridine synthase